MSAGDWIGACVCIGVLLAVVTGCIAGIAMEYGTDSTGEERR